MNPKQKSPLRRGDTPTATDDGAPRGLVCRRCGCRHFEVSHTIREPGGRIKRRRVCRYCGHPMITFERESRSPVG